MNPSENEFERLSKLYSYEILDTPAEITFEKIAVLAAQIFNTPIAQITFVDDKRVFFKSNVSPLQAIEIPREKSFCTHAILSDKPTIFRDTLKEPALSNLDFVTMQNGVRFYAGAPLKTKEGLNLGTVCVLDLKPRTVTKKQLEMLEALSAIVIDKLEIRLATRKAIRIQSDTVNRIVHDLKNPSTTIKLSAELINKKKEEPILVNNLADRIIKTTDSMLNNLNNMLDLSQIEEGSFKLKIEVLDLATILKTVKSNLDLIAESKNQSINLLTHSNILVSADNNRLLEIFENLLSNALKYAYEDTHVLISTEVDETHVIVEIKDEGQGLTEIDQSMLFNKFARLSAIPTGKEHSNGLGLYLVKSMVELHKGTVWAVSEGKNLGCSFFVRLPLTTPI